MKKRGPALVVFHSGSKALLEAHIDRARAVAPEWPLIVISETQPSTGRWIQWYPFRSLWQNLARTRDMLRCWHPGWVTIMLEPGQPYWQMRCVGFLLAPTRLLCFNETLSHFRLHPRSALTMVRHSLWRLRNFIDFETHRAGHLFLFLWRLYHPLELKRPLAYEIARLSGALAGWKKSLGDVEPAALHPDEPAAGISVVIPSRDGRHLLDRLLPALRRQLAGREAEIIVVDNGSGDGSAEWLRSEGIIVVEEARPLAFAAAANRGIQAARYGRILLLNNDMLIEEGFVDALEEPFQQQAELFGSTAQIFFPVGRRREETGKAAMPAEVPAKDFPVRCLTPIAGEDQTYVLYGSGGCTLYDARKLKALGGFAEVYTPAYVEDLDLGYRAWQRGWPTVFAARSRVYHFHQSTTSRYFDAEARTRMVEVNYLRFVARSVHDRDLHRRLWRHATWRMNLLAAQMPFPPAWAFGVLWEARKAWKWAEVLPEPSFPEKEVLALTSGDVSVFPGRARGGKPVLAVASPFLPFPLSHGGAVRVFNLLKQAQACYDIVLVAFSEEMEPPADELLAMCREVVVVQRHGTHLRPMTDRPDMVEEFDSPAFHGAWKLTLRKWKPVVAQLEMTWMASYAADCGSVPVVLVEHDITFDLYEQLQTTDPSWENGQQLKRWRRYERDAWRQAAAVVVMSEKDRAIVSGARCEVLPNGVDVERFQPSPDEPEPGRILFIGAFQHLPNLLALDFFLREVWPALSDLHPVLHVIAGSRHEQHLAQARERAGLEIDLAGVEVEGFVSDVRKAYARAEVVVAPLLASAGTNIKIFEALAMGKAVVSTPAGINGIPLENGREVLVESDGPGMASAIRSVLADRDLRQRLGTNGRARVAAEFSWEAIGRRQAALYETLRSTV